MDGINVYFSKAYHVLKDQGQKRRGRALGSIYMRYFCVGAIFLALAASPVMTLAQDMTLSDARLQADLTIVETLPPAQVAAQYLARGLARKRLGRNDDALIDLTLAINPNALPAPDQARALVARGQILEITGDKIDAAADYAGARRLAPDTAQIPTSATAAPARGASQDRIILKPPAGADSVPDQPAPDDRVILKPPSSTLRLVPPKSASDRPVILKPPPGSAALDLKPSLMQDAESGQSQIQLGSWRTQLEADEAWTAFRARAGDLLDGLSPNISPVDLPGKGRYYRLRLGPMDKAHASSMCAALKSRKMACLIAN